MPSTTSTVHKADLFKVEVYRKPDVETPVPLWRPKYGSETAWSITRDCLAGLDTASPNGAISLRAAAELPDLQPEEIGRLLHRGRSGLSSTISDGNQTLLHKMPEHVDSTLMAVLFHFPKHSTAGRAAFHVTGNGGYRTALEPALQGAFDAHGLILRLTPIVDLNAYTTAITQGHVKALRLSVEAKDDPALLSSNYAHSRFGGNLGKIEVTFKPVGKYLPIRDLADYLTGNNQEDLSRVLVFEDLPFDNADVEIELPDKRTRMYRIGDDEGRTPISQYLHLDYEDTVALGAGADADQEGTLDLDVAANKLTAELRDVIHLSEGDE
ncbi:hypothetical protein [Candidatus Poriferisodalis sp.]|uniref:hypothetical protein n=1 Tax=Candidatus Poriferisodalis sp. TaxID=3101277 RepID=UPI003B013ACB